MKAHIIDPADAPTKTLGIKSRSIKTSTKPKWKNPTDPPPDKNNPECP